MTIEETGSRISNYLAPVDGFKSLAENRINMLQREAWNVIENFAGEVEARIARQEVRLTDMAAVITLNAYWHINRAYFHASPGLVGIVMGIVKIVNLVISAVKFITSTQIFKLLATLHKIAIALWPEYKAAVDKVLKSISDVSSKIGMGVDGLSHLMQIAQSTTGAIAGLMGKSYSLFNEEIYTKYQENSIRISGKLKEFEKNPSVALESVFSSGKFAEYGEVKTWWENVYRGITNSISVTEKALGQIGGVIEDILEFEATLPDFIREHIPQSIYDGLAWTDKTINVTLLPAIAKIDNKIGEVNAVLESYRKRADGLVDKLAHPGDVLLGVDDLPEYARKNQLALIDDVTSREFADRAAAERYAMSADLSEFAIVTAALSPPTPEPAFLGIETPERYAITGIVAEPHETWFVGDF